jgi:SNF2 family DNA or RNA helicase
MMRESHALKAIVEGIRAKFYDVELTREQLHEYQRIGYNFLKENPFSALFIDMGLGKTVTSLTLIADLLAEFADDNKVLVIGPLKVATRTWPDEIRKWKHLAHLNHSVIHVDEDDPRIKEAYKAAYRYEKAHSSEQFPSKREKEAIQHATRVAAQKREELRIAATLNSASVHMISRDWIDWLVTYYRVAKKPWPYRTIIIDESSGFKDHNSGRFKALQMLVDNGKVDRLHLLTATPATEGYMGLFPQIYLLDRGKRLGRNVTSYRERYFTEDRYTRKWKLRPDAEKEILAKITDICLVMKEEDYLPKVPPLFVNRNVFMTPEQRTLYLTMEKDMVVTLDDGTEVQAETAAALSAKLLQMASGVLYDTKLEPGQTEEDDHVKITKIHKIHEHKIEELKQIVEEAQGKPILVGYHHRSSRDRLLKAFPQAVKMDKDGKNIKKWNQGKIPILLMHPQSGGHGLNLQAGGHIIVFFDIPWSLELYLQFIGRLARQGQKHRVTVFLLVCKDTLDETVVKALTAKEDAQDQLFKILKRMRHRLRSLLKGRKIKADDPEWDKVVDVLTGFADLDDDMVSKGVTIGDGLRDEELVAAIDDDEL